MNEIYSAAHQGSGFNPIFSSAMFFEPVETAFEQMDEHVYTAWMVLTSVVTQGDLTLRAHHISMLSIIVRARS